METINLKVNKDFSQSIKRAVKVHKYKNQKEFIRKALQDKLAELEEQEILNDPDMMQQLRESEKNMKKGKFWKLEY